MVQYQIKLNLRKEKEMNWSKLRSSELSSNNRCTKRRTHEINLWSEKTPTINKPAACRRVLMAYLAGKLNAADIPAELEKEFDKVGYISKAQMKENCDEMTKQLVRYVAAEEAAKGSRIFLDPKPMTINTFGTDIEVKPDAVVITGNRIEVIKYKFKKPDIAQTGARADKSVTTSLECYALWKYGFMCSSTPDDVVAAGYIFTGKDGVHEHDIDFGALEPQNQTGYRMLVFTAGSEDVVDNIFQPVWVEFQTGTLCDDADCQFCQFYNACHFNEAPIVVQNKQNKKMGDVQLSPAQESAVAFVQGIGRIKAGAGAGKTLVVALRVMTLLAAGYDPEKMLLITFTVNGAEEMRQRIKFFCDDFGFPSDTADKIRITTFNSFGMLAVENEWASLGYTECPGVVDSIVRKKMILEACEGITLPGVNYKAFEAAFGNGGFDTICNAFDYFKNFGLNSYNWDSEDEVWKNIVQNAPVPIDANWMLAYDKYDAALKEANLLEYADQQRLLEVILADDPYYIENKFGFEHIIVDEFQDTSDREIGLLKKMVDSTTFVSLLVVGDDSQNIFESMRYTNNENIINFDEKIGEEITDFELMENYRSTPEVIDIANKINSRRTVKLDGDLVAKRPSGKPIEVFAFASQKKEYRYIGDEIEKKIADGIKPESIAFIAKDGNELKAMGDELTKRGIPSQLLTPEKVAQNSRVIAAIALAEFIANTEATQCAFDFLNTVQNGTLFDKTDAEIEDAIETFKKEIEASKTEGNDIDTFITYSEQLDITDETYAQFKEKLDKFSNFDDLLDYARAMKRFGQKETYRRKVYAGKGVILTTVHSSKGLEWPVVFVSVTKFNNVTKLEESRRVLFTAVTRARDELIVTSVANKKGRAYIEEIFGYVGKEFKVIEDDDDSEKKAQKERAAEVREIVKKSMKENEAFHY